MRRIVVTAGVRRLAVSLRQNPSARLSGVTNTTMAAASHTHSRRQAFHASCSIWAPTPESVSTPGVKEETPLVIRTISDDTGTAVGNTPPDDVAHGRPTTFAELGLSPAAQRAVADARWEHLTEIQSATWAAVRAGQDVLGRARTGTGKTVAYLLPSVERLADAETTVPPDKIRVLILSPTRELAQQIGQECQRWTAYQPTIQSTLAVYGGQSKKYEIQQVSRRGVPTILTATPGRLWDHMQSTMVSFESGPHDTTDDMPSPQPFRHLLSDVEILVLDEMDVLLDMGFRERIRDILRHLPRNRQTLLFSATTSSAVDEVKALCLRPDYELVDCVENSTEDAVALPVIQQSFVVLPLDKVVWGVVQVLLHLMMNPQNKILVFFPTTAQVRFYSRLLTEGLGRSVLELHAQLGPGRRRVVSEGFRRARRRAVLLTTDLSARGMDYPHVTHVVQVGAPSHRAAYIHRLGRTGRAGRPGQGLLLLTPLELPVLAADLEGLGVEPHVRLQALSDTPDLTPALELDRMRVTSRLRRGEWPELQENGHAVYEALLGYYASRLRQWSKRGGNRDWKDGLVEWSTEFCRQVGMNEMPALSRRLARQLDLMDHPGVVVRDRWESGRTFDVGQLAAAASAETSVWKTLGADPPAAGTRDGLPIASSGVWDDELDP
jgi:ATP-dependent RNA helicase MSS116